MNKTCTYFSSLFFLPFLNLIWNFLFYNYTNQFFCESESVFLIWDRNFTLSESVLVRKKQSSSDQQQKCSLWSTPGYNWSCSEIRKLVIVFLIPLPNLILNSPFLLQNVSFVCLSFIIQNLIQFPFINVFLDFVGISIEHNIHTGSGKKQNPANYREYKYSYNSISLSIFKDQC